MTSEAFTIVYNKALDLVSRREHSRHELMQKLDKRYPETLPIIEEALEKLALNNILDDERFAEMYLNSRARKGFGPKKIEMELYSKKVDSVLISIAIEAYENWTENAKNELKKKFKGSQPTDYQSKMKQKQFLFNRGFSTQIIEQIL
jgi:regulatory protein